MAENEEIKFPLKEEFKGKVEEKTETPIVEEVVKDKVEEETPEKVVEAETKKEEVAPKVETPDSSLSIEDISELTKGSYKTTKELYEAYEGLNSKVTGKTVIEQFNEQIAAKFGEGVTYADVVEFQNYNFDEMNNFDLLEHHLNFEDPEITDKEIKAELIVFDLLKKSESEIQEMIDNEEITRAEYENLEAKMIRKTRLAKTALKEYQSSLSIEDLDIHSPNQKVVQPTKSAEELKADADRYDAEINSLSEFKIEVGTKEDPYSLDLKVSEEDRNGVRNVLMPDVDGRNWIEKRWIMKDGLVDMKKLSADIYKLENHDRNVGIAFTQGKSAGVKKEVKDISNINFSKGQGVREEKLDSKAEAAKTAKEINN